MGWDTVHDPPEPESAGDLVLIETCWRLKGRSRRVLKCGIYRTAAGLEVRCEYSFEELVRSQVAAEIGPVRERAEWRQAVLARSGFEQEPPRGT